MLKNILGAIVFTAAVFALVNFIGDAMVNPTIAPQSQRVASSEAPAKPAAPVAKAAPVAAPKTVAKTVAETAPVAAPEQVAALAGDAVKGKKVFRRKCMGCHTVGKGEADRTGPNLWAIVGRDKGASEGYRYSKPMMATGGVWSEADLLGFIAGPRTFLPDTKMTFAGVKKEADRVNILAYLKALKD